MTIAPEVRQAVIDAYYARTMTSSDAARRRAQAAYGIASGLAAAVLAAGLLGDLDHRADIVQVAALVAFLTWIISAGLFLHTVASSSLELPSPPEQSGADAFVTGALTQVRAERTEIDRWLRRAQVASGIAAATTLAAFIIALEAGPPDTVREVKLAITARGSAALAVVCDRSPRTLIGTMDPAHLKDDLVEVMLDAGVCARKPVLVAIPRDTLRAVSLQSGSG